MSTARTTKRIGTATAVAAAAAVVALASGIGGSDAAPAGARPTTGELTPTVLVARAIVRPYGVVVASDGTEYISEPEAGRVYRRSPSGDRTVLAEGLASPTGLALGAEGLLFVADGKRISTIDAAGHVGGMAIPGASSIDAVGVDGTGAVYATDTVAHKVFQVDPDGPISTVAFTGVTDPRGIDVTADGTVSVIDGTTKDVVRRAPDGTQTVVDLTDLQLPKTLDIEGDRLVIGDGEISDARARVVLREADGSQAAQFLLADPGQVQLLGDGTIYAADTGHTGCRCPEPAGTVLRQAPGGEAVPEALGDVGQVGSVAAAGPSTVLFTSWRDNPGYSDPNPLREVVGTAGPTDIPIEVGKVIHVDAAPDGTMFLETVPPGRFRPVTLWKRSADGSQMTRIALPSNAATPEITAISVDEDGRLFVAMSTGYGNGPFAIIEPLAPGGARTWYRTPDDAQVSLQAMAAGDGKVFVVVAQLDGGVTDLSTVTPDGKLQQVRRLPTGSFSGMDVDVAGNVYLIATSGVKAQQTPISVVAADGTIGTITWSGGGSPVALSVGTDGTLYVADSQIGLISFADVGAMAGDDGLPVAPPAQPVPGSSGFTG